LLALKLASSALGPEYEARLSSATPAMIDRYLERLLSADSLASVFGD